MKVCILHVDNNVPVGSLGQDSLNAISCFEPGPQEPFRDIVVFGL
jgi:hypothetical protein